MLEYPDLSAGPSATAAWASEGNTFFYNQPFLLECGELLPDFKLVYSTYGTLNAAKDNVIWVCHALTANANVLDWWKELFGPGKLYDTNKYYIVCANVLGSCYGSTGPLHMDSRTGAPYYHNFPNITIRDVVQSFMLLADSLHITNIHTCIGGSLGGQQALEWAIMEPKRITHLVLLATNAQTSPWGIALNETQRMAIRTDPTWQQSVENAGIQGMKTARAIALLSYRSYTIYGQTQADHHQVLGDYKATTYQRYQGDKFAGRFNAYSYWALTNLLDSHNVARGRTSVISALHQIEATTLVIGIDSDLLFPIQEQAFLAEQIRNARLEIISSDCGHDGFLLESQKIELIIRNFYNS